MRMVLHEVLNKGPTILGIRNQGFSTSQQRVWAEGFRVHIKASGLLG